jgi:hypothetical protein
VGNLDVDLSIAAAGRVKCDKSQGYHHQDNNAKSVDKKTSRVVHLPSFLLEPGVHFAGFSSCQ